MELAVALIFLSVVTLSYAFGSLGQRPEQRRLAKLAGDGKPAAATAESQGVLAGQELSWFDRLMQPFASKQSKQKGGGGEALTRDRQRLIYAGYRRETSAITYTGSKVVFAILLPLLVLATPAAWELQQIQLVAALLAASGLGLTAPSIWLDQKVKARQKNLRLALPDALDLMVVCVEAGLGINASLKRVAEDFRGTHPILSAEFELANFETRAGKSTTEALRALGDRTGVQDVSSLVAMLIQTERFGTGLADTLRVHADGMRLRRLQSAEEQANKAPLKMLFPTVLIFVAMMVMIIGPGFLQMTLYFKQANG
jgi:tight adherence protein C